MTSTGLQPCQKRWLKSQFAPISSPTASRRRNRVLGLYTTKLGCISNASLCTLCSRANLAASFQYGTTFSFHCQSSACPYSGGQRYVTQLGVVSVGDPPGHPEKPTITCTPSFSASRTVFRNVCASRPAILASGWTGLPWQLNAPITIFRSSNFFFHTFSFAGSANRSFRGQ